jgi:hypothetical protein
VINARSRIIGSDIAVRIAVSDVEVGWLRVAAAS